MAAAALAVQVCLSALYGLLVGWLVHEAPLRTAVAFGLAFGLALYVVNFHVIVPTTFPWFEPMRGAFTAVAHGVFGAAAAAAYHALRAA